MNDLKNLRQVGAPPTVIRDLGGRLVIIDDAVLELIRGTVPTDEPAPSGVKIHQLRPLRLSFASRVRC